jgi:hypothetical protein
MAGIESVLGMGVEPGAVALQKMQQKQFGGQWCRGHARSLQAGDSQREG